MVPGWFDARGCLTEEGTAALRGAPPGAASADLAGHVASCERCQQRLLSLESVPRKGARDPRAQLHWRNLALLTAVLLLMLVGMLVTAWRISG